MASFIFFFFRCGLVLFCGEDTARIVVVTLCYHMANRSALPLVLFRRPRAQWLRFAIDRRSRIKEAVYTLKDAKRHDGAPLSLLDWPYQIVGCGPT